MLISTLIVWSREGTQRTLINHRLTYLIKGFLTQNKEEKRARREADKLFTGQTDRKETPEMEGSPRSILNS